MIITRPTVQTDVLLADVTAKGNFEAQFETIDIIFLTLLVAFAVVGLVFCAWMLIRAVDADHRARLRRRKNKKLSTRSENLEVHNGTPSHRQLPHPANRPDLK